jgi:hypothetical protein
LHDRYQQAPKRDSQADVQPPHGAKIDQRKLSPAQHQDIARMRIGGERALDKDLLEQVAEQPTREREAIDVQLLQPRPGVADADAVEPLQDQQPSPPPRDPMTSAELPVGRRTGVGSFRQIDADPCRGGCVGVADVCSAGKLVSRALSSWQPRA